MTTPAEIPATPVITREQALLLLGAFASEQQIGGLLRWANDPEHPDNAIALTWLLGQRENTRNRFAVSLLASLPRFGTLTEGQVRACAGNVERDAEKAVERAERTATAAPFSPVSGQHTVTGKVLTVRLKTNRFDTYGVTFKATLEITEGPWTGNRLWMTLPRGVREAVGSDDPRDFTGVMMEVTGTIERAADDPHFGFLARPRATYRGKP